MTDYFARESSMNRHCVITTSWDDGFPYDLRLADLLAKHSLPATFYIPIRPATPVVTPAQIREIASIFEIGAHTVRHVPLTRLPPAEAEAELCQSRAGIEQITGKPCPIFCFPQGKFSPAHLPLVRKAGFLACRTVAALSFDRPALRSGILVMPTTAQAHTHARLDLVRNVVKRCAFRPAWNWLLCGLRSDWMDLAKALLDRAIVTGGVFHLWGHSWEIENQQQWKRLDRFFAHLAAHRLQAAFRTNSEVCCAAENQAESRALVVQ
jgi:peptidoglycan/xylan/chitin deacetylase (PgdA/CDA1 family)